MPNISSYTEWDHLEEVIVGSAINVCSIDEEPALGYCDEKKGVFNSFGTYFGCDYKDTKKTEAVQKQLDNLALVLKNEGCIVHRPETVDWKKKIVTPDWEVPVQYGSTCPRDVLLVVGDEIIETNMAFRSRFFEFSAYRKLVQGFFQQGRCMWSAMPKCLLSDKSYRKNYPHHKTKERDTAVFDKQEFLITEEEPIMEAADAMRFGKDIFIQKSHVTNFFGIDWMRKKFAPKGFRVHSIQFNKNCSRHMDDVFVPLKPYFAVLSEPCEFLNKDMKKLFKDNGWKVVTPPRTTFYGYNGVNKKKFEYTGINSNVLSIDEKRIVVDEDEKPTIKFLEDYGFKCIPVPINKCIPYGGSVHCCTTDLRRKGGMKSYFKTLDEKDKLEKEKKIKEEEDKQDKEN